MTFQLRELGGLAIRLYMFCTTAGHAYHYCTIENIDDIKISWNIGSHTDSMAITPGISAEDAKAKCVNRLTYIHELMDLFKSQSQSWSITNHACTHSVTLEACDSAVAVS